MWIRGERGYFHFINLHLHSVLNVEHLLYKNAENIRAAYKYDAHMFIALETCS